MNENVYGDKLCERKRKRLFEQKQEENKGIKK